MKIEEPDREAIQCDGTTAVGLCDHAIETLHEALDLHPDHLQSEVEKVENAFVQLRDCLIGLLREDSQAMLLQHSRWRKPLDHVNVAVSLVSGLVYPSAGIHRVRIEEARDTIRKVKQLLTADR